MNPSFLKTVLAGIAGTIVMTILMMVSAKMGMPKMDPPAMMATAMGVPIAVGWVMHFMIGIVFALIYVYVIRGILTGISSVLVKGAIFGVIAAIIGKVGMTVMGMIFPAMPEPQGSMPMILMGLIMGHVVFGIVVAFIVHRD